MSEHDNNDTMSEAEDGTRESQLNELDTLLDQEEQAATDEVADEPAADPKQQPQIDPAKVIGPLVGNVFTLVALRAGPQWRLHPDEHKALTGALVDTMEYYATNVQVSPLVTLGFTVFGIVVPRLAGQFQDGKVIEQQGTAEASASADQ